MHELGCRGCKQRMNITAMTSSKRNEPLDSWSYVLASFAICACNYEL